MQPLNLPEPTNMTAPVVRLLTADEIQSIAPMMTKLGCGMPDPASSFIVGTVDLLDGHVTSFLVVQLRIHAEPMWIEPGNEHVFRSLVNSAEEVIQSRLQGAVEVFLFAPAGKVAKLAEVAGLQQLPFCIYAKTIECQPVIQPSDPEEIPITEEEMQDYPGVDADFAKLELFGNIIETDLSEAVDAI